MFGAWLVLYLFTRLNALNGGWLTIKEIRVEDFRDNPKFKDIDDHGFMSRKLPEFKFLQDATEIVENYIPAVEDLLRREVADVGTVFIYDWRVS